MPEVIRVQPGDIKPTADYPIRERILEVLEDKIESGNWHRMDPVPVVRYGRDLLTQDAHEVVAAAFLHNVSVPAVMKNVDKKVMDEIMAQRARAIARGYHTIQDWVIHTLGPDRYMDKMRILHL